MRSYFHAGERRWICETSGGFLDLRRHSALVYHSYGPPGGVWKGRRSVQWIIVSVGIVLLDGSRSRYMFISFRWSPRW